MSWSTVIPWSSYLWIHIHARIFLKISRNCSSLKAAFVLLDEETVSYASCEDHFIENAIYEGGMTIFAVIYYLFENFQKCSTVYCQFPEIYSSQIIVHPCTLSYGKPENQVITLEYEIYDSGFSARRVFEKKSEKGCELKVREESIDSTALAAGNRLWKVGISSRKSSINTEHSDDD